MFVVAVSDPRWKGYWWVWSGLSGCDLPVFELIKHTGKTYRGPFSSADIFSSGMWPLLNNHPELRRLAQALPATVLKSRADSTSKKNLGAYRRWKVWADAKFSCKGSPSGAVHAAPQ